MRHFIASQWADLVRGVASERDRIAMEYHLSSGCESCLRIVNLLRNVKDVAEAEAKYNVPEYAVRTAKEIFALQRPERVYILPNVVARLIYDSFQEPLPAGVRSHCRLTRQALYEAGSYSLDLRLEHEQGAAAVTLVGQIADRAGPDKAMANLPVLLVSGRKIVANTLSNPLGEFQFEYHPARHLRLYIETESARNRIEVPLNQLDAKVPGDGGPGSKATVKKPRKKL